MTTPNGLVITKITAENILKFEQFSLDTPDKLTLFRGPNNQGKTTALKLLSLAVKGASDPQSIIHDGADKGEIVLDFAGYKLRRSFTEKGQYLKITDGEGRVLPKPQQWLDEKIGEFRDFNPLGWLTLANSDSAEDRRRAVATLLRAIDVKLTPAEFTAATGLDVPFGVSFDQHGLLVLDALREHFSEERKIENRTADQKRKAASEARATLPAERPVITDARRQAAADALSSARAAKNAIEVRKLAATSHTQAAERLDTAIAREVEDRARIARDIESLQSEIAAIEEKIARRRDDIFASTQREAAYLQEKVTLAASAPPSPEEIEEVNVAVRHANELAREIQADELAIARFDAVDSIDEEANNAAARAGVIDATIKTISGELRDQLLAKAKLPVGALAIDGDRITVGGHELQHCAESQQIRVALAIARSLNPQLKVIILDGSERLDAATFAAFLTEIRGDGFRYFASEVDRNGSVLEIVSFGEDGTTAPAIAEVA